LLLLPIFTQPQKSARERVLKFAFKRQDRRNPPCSMESAISFASFAQSLHKSRNYSCVIEVIVARYLC
jgi:hypothetical protein